MGYSISTPLKSEAARDEMWAFMQAHYRSWCDIEPPEDELQPRGLPEDDEDDDEDDDYMTMRMSARVFALPQGPCNRDYDWTTHILRDGELDYDKGKARIGFNYSTSHGPFGDYAHAILRWMALRAGRRRPFKKQYGLSEAVPYTIYDGHEAWPVLLEDEWGGRAQRSARWCLTKPNGFRQVRREWIPPEPESVERKVILHTMPSKDAVVEMFRKQRLPEDWILEAAQELDTLPATFEGSEPTWLRRIFDELQDLGCEATLEKGPFVLDGWRKETADCIEHAYLARERAINAELTRLSELWENR